MKTAKPMILRRIPLTESVTVLSLAAVLFTARPEDACSGAPEGLSQVQNRKTSAIEGRADRNSLETKKATESTALRIQVVEKEQLFGTALSWKLHPPEGQPNAQIIAWVEEVSDPSHPRRLGDELNRRLDGDGLMQYGFIGGEFRGDPGIRIGVALNGYRMSTFEKIVPNDSKVQKQAITCDGNMDIAIPVNETVIIATIELQTSVKHERYTLNVKCGNQ